MMISVIDLLLLSQIPNIGPGRLRALVSHFDDTGRIFSASAREIAVIEGFSRKLAASTTQFIRSSRLEVARRYSEDQLSRLNKTGGRVMTFWDREYPEHLKRIYDPPPLLYVRGEVRETDRYAVAIVGTRSPSDYGVMLSEKFSHEFVRIGVTVVSGLARGVDTVAHATAVKYGGRTIAVIGSGLDVIYPHENKSLCERISGQGAVISEYGMGAKPDAVNFPRRNRIISGLSLGTLVIETDLNGGAMITANMALDQNREVFAVPGNIGSKRSRGCNALIRDGKAKLVENLDDILCELAPKLRPLLRDTVHGKPQPIPELSLFEKALFDALGEAPLHIDAIAGRVRMSTADVLVNLLSLEFKGIVKQLPGKMFVRSY